MVWHHTQRRNKVQLPDSLSCPRLREFPYPEWHKKEKENILSNVGIKVEYGEPGCKGEYRGTFRMVSDKEREEMVRLYVEERLRIEKIAAHFSCSSRTPLVQFRNIIEQ